MKTIFYILVALSILLVMVVMFHEQGHTEKAYFFKARSDVRSMTGAIKMHLKDVGTLPSSFEDLVPNYLSQIPVDPWGNGLIYEKINETNFVVYSLGSDGKKGGFGLAADIYFEAER